MYLCMICRDTATSSFGSTLGTRPCLHSSKGRLSLSQVPTLVRARTSDRFIRTYPETLNVKKSSRLKAEVTSLSSSTCTYKHAYSKVCLCTEYVLTQSTITFLFLAPTHLNASSNQPLLAIRPSSYMHAALTFAGSWLISQSVFVLFPPIVLPTYLSTLLS